MSFSPPAPASIDGSAFRIGVVAARYNPELVDALVAQVSAYLVAAGVAETAIELWRVPGSNEVPVAVQAMAKRGGFDAIVALGVIIRGGTIHYEVIAFSSADALQAVALASGVPVINGIVVAENEMQARERCLGAVNRGAEFAWAALEMAALRHTRFPSGG
ncbi:MAG: 6,7-dimethyl-8-ribityllumazine synthase [Burkholderiales bacterium]|jgi:6,7-dimethyl-8-ribityllumazine synthase|nr:6,7-dimethyl-8-ribityllumazine synthase [Burkholderiales bacterium]